MKGESTMNVDKAHEHAEIAEKLLDRIKIDKRMGREMDVKDGNNAAVASAHATLALFYQREAEAGR
jgi:hypothetical protein